MTTTSLSSRIDVREIAPRERHPLILSTFRSLGVSQAMEIVNDHDPKPLYYQFQSEAPGQFSWDYLEHGPDVFRVRITRLTKPQGTTHGDAHAKGQCCGGCGGQ